MKMGALLLSKTPIYGQGLFCQSRNDHIEKLIST